MAKPASRQELKDYALRRLGHPVIDINVEDGQMEDRLDDALQFFAEYHFDGVERVYNKHLVTSTDISNGYITIPDGIMSVLKVFRFDEGTTNMFDVRYQMALNDFFDMSGSGSVVEYDQTRRYINMLNDMLNPERMIRFSRVTNQLHIDMKWGEILSEGDYVVYEGWKILDPDTYTEIYDDRLLKEYVTALIKRQWGQNLSKFDGIQLPGGVTFNGGEIYSQADEEVKKIEEEVELKYELPTDFFTG
tara:strand:- start:956 stop:1696 length:741 start_codon:yes stop_codon:yes gene_type:complete